MKFKNDCTPGGWQYEKTPGNPHSVTAFEIFDRSHERPIGCMLLGMVAYTRTPGQAEANARLMAAAPELLAACQYVADLTNCALSKEQAETLGKRCRAAIEVALTGKGVRNV